MFCREIDSDKHTPCFSLSDFVSLSADQLPLEASGFPKTVSISCWVK
ncbi:hypothetical protein SynBMKMC1_02663 [Synechococcus sp. BMK-MC-1]|nr:hypothetical protein SynBMKMC1_02663 [Synechococcus sp. BMK-MC-1]